MLRLDLGRLRDWERRTPVAVRWGLGVALPLLLLLAELLATQWPLDLTIPLCDAHDVLPAAAAYGRWLRGELALQDLLSRAFTDQQPPLFPTLQLLYYILTDSYRGVVLFNLLPATIITVVAFDVLARRYSWPVGVLAVVLMWSFPTLRYQLLFRVGIEMTLAALVTLCLATLLHSDGLRRRRHALLLGAWVALAALTKTTFVLHLALPVLYLLVRVLRAPDRGRRLVNAALAAAVVAATALPWYVANVALLLGYGHDEVAGGGAAAALAAGGVVERLTALSRRFLMDAGPLPLALIAALAVGVLVAWWMRGRRSPVPGGDLLVLLAPLATMVAFSLIQRSPESCRTYVEFPVLAVPLAMAAGALIHALSRPLLQAIAAAAVLAAAVVPRAHDPRRTDRLLERIRAVVAASRAAEQRIRRDMGREGARIAFRARTSDLGPPLDCPGIHGAYFRYFAGWHGKRDDVVLVGCDVKRPPDQLEEVMSDAPGRRRARLLIRRHRAQQRDYLSPPRTDLAGLDYLLLWHDVERHPTAAVERIEARGEATLHRGRTVGRWERGDQVLQLIWFPGGRS